MSWIGTLQSCFIFTRPHLRWPIILLGLPSGTRVGWMLSDRFWDVQDESLQEILGSYPCAGACHRPWIRLLVYTNGWNDRGALYFEGGHSDSNRNHR